MIASQDPKFLKMLRLARLLSDTAPRRWSARDLSSALALHPRSVYRYLVHLDPVLPVCRDGTSYWLERRSPLSDVPLRSANGARPSSPRQGGTTP